MMNTTINPTSLAQNKELPNNPEVTFYKVNYNRSSNFKILTKEIQDIDTGPVREIYNRRVKQIITPKIPNSEVIVEEMYSLAKEMGMYMFSMYILQSHSKSHNKLQDEILLDLNENDAEAYDSEPYSRFLELLDMSSAITTQTEVNIRPVKDIFQDIISEVMLNPKYSDLNDLERGFLEKKVRLMLSVQSGNTQDESNINETHISIIKNVVNEYLEKREDYDFRKMPQIEDTKVDEIFQKIINEHDFYLTEFDMEDIGDRICEALDIIEKCSAFGFSKEQVEACKTPVDIQKLMIEFHERVIRKEIKEYMEFKEIIQKTIEEYPFENLLENSDKINIENRIREVVRFKEEEVGFEFDIEEAEFYKEFINQEIKEYLSEKSKKYSYQT